MAIVSVEIVPAHFRFTLIEALICEEELSLRFRFPWVRVLIS